MDGTTALIVIVLIFGAIILAVIWRYRHRIQASIDVGGASMSVSGENAPEPAAPTDQPPAPAAEPASSQPGVRVSDVESSEGGVLADDKTGKGAVVERAKTKDDIIATSSPPDPDPKA